MVKTKLPERHVQEVYVLCEVRDSDKFRDIEDEPLRVLPAQAGIGDGLSIDMVLCTNFLCAFYQIAFNHQSLDEPADIIGVSAASQHLFGDTDLFHKLFAGVGVIDINDTCRIHNIM